MDPFKKLREDTDLCLMHLIVICTRLLPYNCFFFRGGSNFCYILSPKYVNFNFCDFTPRQSDFYSLSDMKNLMSITNTLLSLN